MGYSKNTLIIRELPLATSINPTDLVLMETASASQGIQFQDLMKSTSSVFYGFYIGPTGDLLVDVINDASTYDGTIYKEWYLGGVGATFFVDSTGNLNLVTN